MEIIKVINKYKGMIVAGLVLIAVVVAIFVVKDAVMFDESKAEYGNRLEGMDKVKVTEEQKKKIKDALKDGTRSVNIKLSGRTINLIIETNADVSVQDAKALADKALEIFTEDQKKYYDIEALIKNDDDKDHYPIIGYKHKSRGNYIWTRDR